MFYKEKSRTWTDFDFDLFIFKSIVLLYDNETSVFFSKKDRLFLKIK